MDTVEELNGTYFYKGISNITASELFFWILLDEVSAQMGDIGDLSAVALIILGQPIIGTRRYLDVELPFLLPTFTNASLRYLKPMWVNNLGKFVGRAVPVLG